MAAPRGVFSRAVEAAETLGLVLAEVALRYSPDSSQEDDDPEAAWTVVGLTPFLTPSALQDQTILDTTLALLRRGLEKAA